MRSGRCLQSILPVAAALLLLPSRALAEPPPAPPREDTPAVPEPSDYRAPDPMPTPPGAPADQALWKRAMDDSNALVLVKATSSRLQWKARNGKYDERLPAQAKDLARRLQAAWAANSELATSRWPVDSTRGCQYQAQLLESAMQMADGAEKSAMITPARADVTRCAELAESILRQMNASNDAFEKVLAEADAVLAKPSR